MTDKPPFDRQRSRSIRTMLVSEAQRDVTSGSKLAKRVALLVSLILAALLASTGGVALALTGNIPFVGQPASPLTSTLTPVPTMTPTPTPTPTAKPTPTPTPRPSIDLSAPETWIIGEGTVGPITLGQSRADAAAAMPAFTKESYQCDVDVYASKVSRMQIVLTPDATGTSVDKILVNSGRDASERSPRTKAGIGLGSTVDDIVAAYPNIQRPDTRLYPTYSLRQPDGTWIDFRIASDTQTVLGITVMRGAYPPPEYCG